MGNDEQKAFELLNKTGFYKKAIIEEFNGRWIKELGDGVMASFLILNCFYLIRKYLFGVLQL